MASRCQFLPSRTPLRGPNPVKTTVLEHSQNKLWPHPSTRKAVKHDVFERRAQKALAAGGARPVGPSPDKNARRPCRHPLPIETLVLYSVLFLSAFFVRFSSWKPPGARKAACVIGILCFCSCSLAPVFLSKTMYYMVFSGSQKEASRWNICENHAF